MNSWRDQTKAFRTMLSETAPFRSAAAGLLAVVIGAVVLTLFPALELNVFSKFAAGLAGTFTGSPSFRVDDGWMLRTDDRPVVVTTACSASHYGLLVAFVISAHLRRRRRSLLVASAAGLVLAFPVCTVINALRVVAVTQVHRWIIPRLPEAYSPFLHLLTGVAVFLPALIALNLFLETYARRSRATYG